MESVDYRKLVGDLREEICGCKKPYSDEALKAIEEAMCGCVLIAEENLREQDMQYENAELAREVIKYAEILEEYDHTLNLLHSTLSRMEDALHEHPRLMVKLKSLHLKVLRRIESIHGHDLAIAEDLMEEISLLERNIYFADRGEFDKIESQSMLKSDPIEWTLEWESIIDKADSMVFSELKDTPRGMGFCFAYWSKRREILEREFGVEWRSPAVMNPRVMFD